MRKISYIANAIIPNTSAHCLQIVEMCTSFKKNNMDVELIMPFRLGNKSKEIKDFYKVPELQVVKLPSIDLTWINSSIIKKIFGQIRSISFGFTSLLYSIFKKRTIYTRNFPTAVLLSIFGSNKVFYEATEYHKSFLLKLARKIIQKKIGGIIVLNKALRSAYIKEGINTKKIHIAPDGVDIDKFDINISKTEARKKINLPLNKKIVLYSGSLYENRGVEETIESAKNIKEAIFVIVGGGYKYNDYISMSKGINNIIFVGQKRPTEIPLYLKAADVLLAPYSWKTPTVKWMSPIKIFEYMASKRPIVISDLPAIREVFDESTSILVKPDSAEAQTKAIKKLLQNEALAKKLAENAYKNSFNYTWINRTKNILKFIENVKN